MPWLSHKRYESLLRAAGERQERRSLSMMKEDITDTGLLFRKLYRKSRPVLPFEYLEVVEVKDRMIVFVVHQGKPVVIEDELHLFPSDKLINALRLLL